MKTNEFDVDLISYMALNEIVKNGSDSVNIEDAYSKMNIHARKLKDNNAGIVIRV